MKNSILMSSVAALLTVCCTASFAQRQVVVGAVPQPLSAAGVTAGVDMTGQGAGGSLLVGVAGGPQMDIFTNNQPTNTSLLAVSTDVASQSNITFNSSSNVFGAVGTPTLLFNNLFAGASGTNVNFNGPVFASATTVTGTGGVSFNSGSSNSTAMIFAGDGTITLAPNTTVIGALTSTAGANTGTLALGAGSVLNGAVGGATGLRAINVLGGSNAAGVNATITGAVDAFAFNLGTNTLNIGGALTIANQAASGLINTTLASTTVFGNIRPVGRTNLGATLQVNVTVPSTTFIPVGSVFNIVQAQTGTVQSGTDGSVLRVTVQSPTNPLYSFSAVPPAGTVAGLVAIRTDSIPLLAPIAPPPGAVLPPAQPIAAAVVPVLLAVTPSADLLNVLAPINAFSNAADVVNALTQLAPSTADLTAPLVTFEGTRQFQSLWSTRMDEVLSDPYGPSRNTTATCSVDESRSRWWAKGLGYFGDQSTVGAFDGYESRILGTMIGYDEPHGKDTRVGVGVGFAHSDINGRTFDVSTDSDTYQLTAYIGHQCGPWRFYGDLSIGGNNYQEQRHIVFTGVNRTASAKYDGQDYTGFANAEYAFHINEFTVLPFASLQYSRLHLDGYTESGAGDIDLRVGSQGYDFLESGLGVRVARAYNSDDGKYVPELHSKWLHLLENPTLQNSAAFTLAGSPALVTPGLKTSADTYNVGAGVTFVSCACAEKNWSIEGVYDHDWRDDGYHADQGTVRFATRF